MSSWVNKIKSTASPLHISGYRKPLLAKVYNTDLYRPVFWFITIVSMLEWTVHASFFKKKLANIHFIMEAGTSTWINVEFNSHIQLYIYWMKCDNCSMHAHAHTPQTYSVCGLYVSSMLTAASWVHLSLCDVLGLDPVKGMKRLWVVWLWSSWLIDWCLQVQ